MTMMKLQCDSQRIAIEKSLRINPTQWITAPLNSILGARGAHSEAARLRLEEEIKTLGARDSRLWKFSVANELADAYGVPSPEASMRISAWELAREIRVQHAEELASVARQVVDKMRSNGVLTDGGATTYLNKLNDWHAKVRNEEAELSCAHQLKPLAPPLGWTLTKGNQTMLNCLAARVAVKEGIASPPIPMPEGIEDTISVLPKR